LAGGLFGSQPPSGFEDFDGGVADTSGSTSTESPGAGSGSTAGGVLSVSLVVIVVLLGTSGPLELQEESRRAIGRTDPTARYTTDEKFFRRLVIRETVIRKHQRRGKDNY
jgi:hypothetical protein